ncbi:DUF3313 family protein [Lichenicoccus sp.]|uniref:DUF3313 family protein n=1 Tax=Lichenicoccus sp. TaxID=2781899 RepID=UPI003D131B91
MHRAIIPFFCGLPRVVAATSVLAVAACGGQGLTQTGFLTSYSQMHPQKGHAYDSIYVRPGFSDAAYTAVIVEPVAWVPARKAPARTPRTIARLETVFHDHLVKSLSRHFTILPDPGPGGDPGPGVLRVRGAITNTRRALWWVNVPAQAGQLALGAVPLLRPSDGGASEEIEVRDAHTNQPVIRIATYNNGQPWNIIGSYEAFGHARRSFSLASDLLDHEIRAGATAKVAQAGHTGQGTATPSL